jgi:hypothetical protein
MSILTLVAVVPLLGLPQVVPPTVFVEAAENGQGVLRGRGKECFLITPHHVVKGTMGTVTITGERGAKGAAEVVRTVSGDLAILRVSERGGLPCPEWNVEGRVATRLRGTAAGHFELREANGGSTVMPVTLDAIDDDRIEVRPAAGAQIEQGMSGASLFVKGSLAGMLLTTNDGTGAVSPIDHVARLTDFFFAPGAAASSAAAARLVSLLDLGQSVGELAVFGLAGKPNRVLEEEVRQQALTLNLKPHARVDNTIQTYYQNQLTGREDVYAFAIGALVRLVPVLKARQATVNSASERAAGEAAVKSAREKITTYLDHLGLSASRAAFPAFAAKDYETLAAEARDYAAAIRTELAGR